MLSRFDTFICDITAIDLYWHRVASAAMKEFGLKGSHAIYFVKLHGEPNGLSAAKLAASCGKDKADVSRDLALLEKMGYVRRVLRDGHTYRASIQLTEVGHQVAAGVVGKATAAVSCVGQDLTETERANFYQALHCIKDRLRELSETGLTEQVPSEKGE